MSNSLKNLVNQATYDIHANGGHSTAHSSESKSESGISNKPENGSDKLDINIANVIISPATVEERDAARRASMKLRTSKVYQLNNDELSSVSESGQSSVQSNLNELNQIQEQKTDQNLDKNKVNTASRDAQLGMNIKRL